MNTRSVKTIHLFAILMILLSGGCSPVSTPPGPDMIGGVYDNTAYQYFHWEEGLNIMIWHDAISSSSCDSSGSTSAKIHVVRCQAISKTKQEFVWQIETNDGLTAAITLSNHRFDLSNGNVFVISTTQNPIEIHQFQRDLSRVKPENESIVEFGLNDPDIEEFIRRTD